MGVYTLFLIASQENMLLFSGDTWHRLMNIAIVCVTLLIVIVPEGLPLAVSITTSFSTVHLRDDNVLIKKLQAVESCGQMTDIVTSKTSTLTTGNLAVNKLYAGQSFHQTGSSPELNSDVVHLLINSILLNSEAYMEIDDETCEYVATGGSIEVGLLNFVETLGIQDLNNLVVRKGRNTELAAKVPFCPTRKIMTVAHRITI